STRLLTGVSSVRGRRGPPRNRAGPPSSSGLGHHPFKVATRIRTPLGAQEDHHAWSRGAAWLCSPPCQGGGRGFKSRRDRSDRGHQPRSPGQVAQSVERAAENRKVGGSIPSLPTRSAQVRRLRPDTPPLDEAEVQGSKRQRVAPYGSAVATPNTVWNLKRYRCQGGGPALGALNGAVNPSPSTCAGHPSSR